MNKALGAITGLIVSAAAVVMLTNSASVAPPKMVEVYWARNLPTNGFYTNADDSVGNYADVKMAVIESHDLREWKLASLTMGTNYFEEKTDRMFFAIFYTNVASGERSDLGGTPK